jgi:hypothetical protein
MHCVFQSAATKLFVALTDRWTDPKIPAQALSFTFDDLINGTNFSSFTIWFQRFPSAAALLGFVLVTGLWVGVLSGGL